MIDVRLLFFWSLDSRFDAGVSSCSSGEFLENRATVTFVTLETAIQSVGTILILKSFTGILTIDGRLACVWSTVVDVKNMLIWDIIWKS